MNKMQRILVAITIGWFALLNGFAQESAKDKSEGWSGASRYNRMYNPQATENISGQVVKVESVSPLKGMGRGIHLLVKTDSETIPVHLGPEWFIEKQDIEIKLKDQIEVEGSRVNIDGKPAIIAAEVRKDNETLTLRDDNGFPVWSAWRSAGAGRIGTMRGGMMRRRMMGTTDQGQTMMEGHQKMMSKLKSDEADLNKKIARMNTAKGEEKIEAMSDVINEMAAQRKEMIDHMASMQKRMMTHMQNMGMEPAGASTEQSGEKEK